MKLFKRQQPGPTEHIETGLEPGYEVSACLPGGNRAHMGIREAHKKALHYFGKNAMVQHSKEDFTFYGKFFRPCQIGVLLYNTFLVIEHGNTFEEAFHRAGRVFPAEHADADAS